MKSMLTICALFAISLQGSIAKKVNVYRYYQGSVVNHFYTTNPNEIGTTTAGQTGNYGYVSEGVGFKLEDTQASGTVPLYRYYRGAVHDHFYTTNAAEIGTTTAGQTGNYGYVSEGILGYCFPTQCAGTTALYRYWQGSVSNHFYTTNAAEIGTTTAGQTGNYGYVSEGVACYVYAASAAETVPLSYVDISDKSGFIESIASSSSIYYMMYIIIALLLVNVVCFGMTNCKGRGKSFRNKYKVVNVDSESEV